MQLPHRNQLRRNIEKHGLDIVGCGAVWENFTVTREDVRYDYDEPRYVCFGTLRGEVVVMVYTERARGPRVMSLRRALKHEARYYRQRTTGVLPESISSEDADDDNPPWAEDMLGDPVLQSERGLQRKSKDVLVAIRIDPEVLAYFKAPGPGYQARIKSLLQQAVKPHLSALPDVP